VLRSAGVPYRELVYITGSDVTRKKPDPELFLLAAERAGVDPALCVVIEDAPDGIAAAKAAGAKCIAVTNSATAEKLTAADRIVDSLAEVGIDRLLRLIEG
jgi:beta-phosphoglucomutase-like phosphatase (HAD superfamily)